MRSFRELRRYLRPYWLPALLAPSLMALEVAMDLMQPKLLGSIVDTGLANRDLGYVIRTGWAMLGAAVVGIIGGVGCTVFAVIASQSFGADLRGALFRKVMSLAFGDLDRLDTGKLVTRLTNDYAGNFTRPLNELASLWGTLQSAVAGAERVFAIMDEPPDLADAEEAVELSSPRGEVVFDRVSFGYDQDVPVLREVSFRAEPNQTIALVGPTGTGKTTIINLLTRFYDVDQGAVRIDGHDLRTVGKDSLRSALGIVLQDTDLFAESVRENLRYGRLDATDEETVAAAELASADAFIRHLPQGYDTPLSEAAATIGQGQRQLLAIAGRSWPSRRF